MCCAGLPLRCMQCLCSFLGCTRAELIPLVMVWLPCGMFAFGSFYAPAFSACHLGSSKCSLLGRGEEPEGFGTVLFHVLFFPVLRWNWDELRVLNTAWPLYPTAGCTQITTKRFTSTDWREGKKVSRIFCFSQMSEKVGSWLPGSKLACPLLCSFAVGCGVRRLAALLLFLVAMSWGLEMRDGENKVEGTFISNYHCLQLDWGGSRGHLIAS